MKKLLLLIFSLVFLSIFAPLSYSAESSPDFRYVACYNAHCNDSALVGRMNVTTYSRDTPQDACLSMSGAFTGNPVFSSNWSYTGYTGTKYQCTNASGVLQTGYYIVYTNKACPAASSYKFTPNWRLDQKCISVDQQSCEASNKFWNTSNSTCVDYVTCTSPQVRNAQTNTCETPLNYCDNTTNQLFDYLASDDADATPLVTKPVSDFEYLCHDTCRYYIDGQPTRCYVLANATSPRAGYCEQNYVPTFQSCTVGVGNKAPLDLTPPADVTTCPQNHTLNSFDVCVPDSITCPADQAPNNQNICENVACQAGFIRETPESPCTSSACPAGQYRLSDTEPCQADAVCQTGQTSIQGACVPSQCQDGYYRNDLTSQCQASNGLNFGMCQHITDTLSNCLKNEGLTSFLVPTSKYCTMPKSVTVKIGSKYCSAIALTNSASHNADGEYINPSETVKANASTVQNWYAAITNPSSPATNYANPQSWEAVYTSKCTDPTKILTNGGQCVPQSCLTDPTSSPTCAEITGGGSSVDMTETNQLLTNIKDLISGDGSSGVLANVQSGELEGELDGVLDSAFDSMTASINEFIDNNDMLNKYNELLPDNPFSMSIEEINGSCELDTVLFGRQIKFSLCSAQEFTRPLLSYFLFIAVFVGIFALIFERQN